MVYMLDQSHNIEPSLEGINTLGGG
jgi:hypothetical protein